MVLGGSCPSSRPAFAQQLLTLDLRDKLGRCTSKSLIPKTSTYNRGGGLIHLLPLLIELHFSLSGDWENLERHHRTTGTIFFLNQLPEKSNLTCLPFSICVCYWWFPLTYFSQESTRVLNSLMVGQGTFRAVYGTLITRVFFWHPSNPSGADTFGKIDMPFLIMYYKFLHFPWLMSFMKVLSSLPSQTKVEEA